MVWNEKQHSLNDFESIDISPEDSSICTETLNPTSLIQSPLYLSTEHQSIEQLSLCFCGNILQN